MLGPNNVVCSLHFVNEEILNFYETKMPDGSINKIKRGRPTLKKGAVPSIFPNLPSYLSSSRKRRKPPCERTESVEVKKKKNDPTIELEILNQIVEEKTSQQNHTEDGENEKNSHLFRCLKDNLEKILTPNGSWSGTFLPGRNEIVFAEWDETYTTKKKIILRYDMTYKVCNTYCCFKSRSKLICCHFY